MVQNILITGAAGYIGGSLLADCLSRTAGPIKAAKIHAAVRSEEQVQCLSELGVNIIQVDLTDERAVNEAVLRNQIDIVVHTAGFIDPRLLLYLIKALGQRREISGEETFFIHSSVSALYSAEAGWPYGEIKDTDPVLEKEKQMGGPHPIRVTNVLVAEKAKEHAVTSFNVAVPNVYGRGSGAWRQLSVSIPTYIRTSIEHKIVYKFDKDGSPAAAHISDLTALYVILLEKILQKESIPSGEEGYYFAMAHKAPWWEVMDRLAKSLHARGLVTEPEPQIWPSYEMASEYLAFPLAHVRTMGTSSAGIVPVNAYRIGWRPKWDEERCMNSMDDEVDAVLELDKHKPTLFDSMIDPPVSQGI